MKNLRCLKKLKNAFYFYNRMSAFLMNQLYWKSGNMISRNHPLERGSIYKKFANWEETIRGSMSMLSIQYLVKKLILDAFERHFSL
jgi:hypothetical protein